jgi:ABC-2 type transport system ATP-binding protein
MLEVSGLVKRFGTRAAVDGVSFRIQRGELFGLLGHNGAGKSTTIGAVLGQLYPDAGTVRVDGHEVIRERRLALARVGAIFETPSFYDYMSGWRNLEVLSHCTRLTTREEIARAVERVGLQARIHDPVGKYSHGMRQRLALAQALLPDPEFLILDEPTDGLDPEGIVEMRSFILDLNRREGLTILLCSHQLDEVQRLCRKLAILRAGRLVFEGDWQQLEGTEPELELRTEQTERSLQDLAEAGLIHRKHERWVLASDAGVADCLDFLIRQCGARVFHAGLRPASLEDVYLKATRGEGT